jgi:hypothetical protein
MTPLLYAVVKQGTRLVDPKYPSLYGGATQDIVRLGFHMHAFQGEGNLDELLLADGIELLPVEEGDDVYQQLVPNPGGDNDPADHRSG